MTYLSKRNVIVKAEFKSEEQRDLYDWMYEASLDYDTPRGAFLWGQAMEIARNNTQWSFWEVLADVRRRNTH